MTENADVEWLRAISNFGQEWLTKERARRLLAHIDQLEAEAAACRSNCEDLSVMVNAQQDRRPTIHENAAQIMAAVTPRGSTLPKESIPECVAYAYDLAEALDAEGRRRDGL